jgi:hypothetical protein
VEGRKAKLAATWGAGALMVTALGVWALGPLDSEALPAVASSAPGNSPRQTAALMLAAAPFFDPQSERLLIVAQGERAGAQIVTAGAGRSGKAGSTAAWSLPPMVASIAAQGRGGGYCTWRHSSTRCGAWHIAGDPPLVIKAPTDPLTTAGPSRRPNFTCNRRPGKDLRTSGARRSSAIS